MGSRAWGSETREAAVPPSRPSPCSEERGRGTRQKLEPQGPTRRAPPHPQPPPAPAAGAHGHPPRSLPRRRRKVFTSAPARRQRTRSPTAARLPTLTRSSLNVASSPCPAWSQAAQATTCDGWRAFGRLPARSALIAAHTPGEVAREPLAAAPTEPTKLEERRAGVRGDAENPPPPSLAPCPARGAHLSCQGSTAPPRLTHAGATVAQCLSKLLISPGAAPRLRLGPTGEVELPGPRPRNTCCCRGRRGHTQAPNRPLPGHWLVPAP